MRFLIPALLITATLAGCDREPTIRINNRADGQASADGVLRVVQTLQCPQTEGVLTRTGAPAVNGLSCTYGGPRGSEVVLHLVRLDGADATAALAHFETRLQGDVPGAVARMAAAPPPPATPNGSAGSREDTDVILPGMSVRTRGDNAVVRLPGISINAEGGSARVRIGGLNIVADDSTQRVQVGTEDDSLQVRAQDDAAEIRTQGQGGGVRASYILVDEAAAAGAWRLVGYEARGPAGGPLVVATVRSRQRHEDDVFDAAKALVTANVGE
jgi:hypothetical protein